MAAEFTTKTQIDALNAKIAAKLNTLSGRIGSLASLATTDKASVVAAINELQALAAAAAAINDSATNTTTAWSGSKVSAMLTSLKSEILGGASAAYDTLAEIQALMAADDTETSGILTALGNRLRFDAAQTLTAPQQAQALSNLAITVSSTDFAATLDAATSGI